MPVSVALSTQILKGLEEFPLPQTPQYTDTFNDTSVHWFPLLKLEGLSEDLWASREEPDFIFLPPFFPSLRHLQRSSGPLSGGSNPLSGLCCGSC